MTKYITGLTGAIVDITGLSVMLNTYNDSREVPNARILPPLPGAKLPFVELSVPRV